MNQSASGGRALLAQELIGEFARREIVKHLNFASYRLVTTKISEVCDNS